MTTANPFENVVTSISPIMSDEVADGVAEAGASDEFSFKKYPNRSHVFNSVLGDKRVFTKLVKEQRPLVDEVALEAIRLFNENNAEYEEKKQEWINANPEKYRQIRAKEKEAKLLAQEKAASKPPRKSRGKKRAAADNGEPQVTYPFDAVTEKIVKGKLAELDLFVTAFQKNLHKRTREIFHVVVGGEGEAVCPVEATVAAPAAEEVVMA